MTINRSNIQSFLVPGMHCVFANYNIYDHLWKQIYKQYRSERAVEYEMEYQTLPAAQMKMDGSPAAQGNMQQMYQTSYVMNYFAMMATMTRATIMDNQYPTEFPRIAENLRNSLDTVKNINSVYIINNGFNENSTVSDGQPLLSTAHPTSTGVLANTFTNGVQFNESSVEDAITLIKSWTNVAGLKINLNSVKALVPQSRAFDAARIFKSEFRTGTANNDINAIVHDKYMPGGYLVNPFLTNPYAWYILTDEENGFKYFQRENLDLDFITDVNTDNVSIRALERYAFGCSNWRAIVGSIGA